MRVLISFHFISFDSIAVQAQDSPGKETNIRQERVDKHRRQGDSRHGLRLDRRQGDSRHGLRLDRRQGDSRHGLRLDRHAQAK